MLICHRDLKPENILLHENFGYLQYPTVKIGDFGFARPVNPNEDMQTFRGTAFYCAPEIHYHKPFGLGCDLWSFGVIMYELILGLHPISRLMDEKHLTFVQIFSHQKPFIFNEEEWTEYSLAFPVVKDLLVYDMKTRMNWEQLKKSEWYNDLKILKSLHNSLKF